MQSSRQKGGSTFSRTRVLAASALLGWGLLGSCVDTTPPWEKVRGQGGAVGAGGAAVDGATAAGGTVDTGVASTGGAGGVIMDAPATGAGGGIPSIDAPPLGAGGAIDAGRGGAGGAPGSDAPVPDVPIPGTGGSAGGIDGGTDAARPGTGGVVGVGGSSGRGGSGGGGGTTSPPDAPRDLAPDVPSGADSNVPLAGLLAYYPCESASGELLPDLSGNANHGKLMSGTLDGGTGSAVIFAAGKVGNAMTLQRAS
jgi:hypothetical protein